MEEEKTITINKLTLWKSTVVILAIALVASVLTGGFGINILKQYYLNIGLDYLNLEKNFGYLLDFKYIF